MKNKELAVVVPLLNEEKGVKELLNQIIENTKKVTNDVEIILVDDGSSDNTWHEILEIGNGNSNVKAIKFSKNFGHHFAISAGIKYSNADWIIVMDGDLQDKPIVIPKLFEKAKQGFEIVFVSRRNRPEKIYYKILQKIFYFILNLISGEKFDSTQANYSIISKNVANAFNKISETTRFYGSTIKWLGFSRSEVEADHGERIFGDTSYSFKKRLKLAQDIILSNSTRLLNISILISVFFMFSGLTYFLFQVYLYNFRVFQVQSDAKEFINLIFPIFTAGLFVVLATLSLYLKNIFIETRKRPLYIIERYMNFNENEKIND